MCCSLPTLNQRINTVCLCELYIGFGPCILQNFYQILLFPPIRKVNLTTALYRSSIVPSYILSIFSHFIKCNSGLAFKKKKSSLLDAQILCVGKMNWVWIISDMFSDSALEDPCIIRKLIDMCFFCISVCVCETRFMFQKKGRQSDFHFPKGLL